MSIGMALGGVATLLGAAVVAVALQKADVRSRLIYLLSLAACLAILSISCAQLLLGSVTVPTAWLPVGLPWVGAHFRMDALAALFLVIVNLGGAGASLFALGYGQHEMSPGRVLPFYPAFLAGMNLVILAADAFTFLVAWEFMSLSSWALVMASHQTPRTGAPVTFTS